MLTLPHFPAAGLRSALFFASTVVLSVFAGQMPLASARTPANASAREPVTPGQTPAVQGGSIASAADEWPSIVIGFIGQSRYQPQAVAALAGAIDAARELGPRHRMHVSVVHRSPQEQTADAQNEALRELFVGDTAGVLIHPVDANASAPLLALLNRQRMPVVTLGTTTEVPGISAAVVDDETAIGEALAQEAFRLLDARSGRRGGGVAVLAGPQGAEPYATRARVVADKVQGSPRYSAYGEFACAPDMTAALQTLQSVTARERDERLSAWISVGGWPLLGYHADLPQTGGLSGFVVAGGLPQMLPYLEQGRVQALVSPDYYGLGYEAMRQVLRAQGARRDSTAAASATEGTSAGEMVSPAQAASSTELVGSAEPVRVRVLPRVIRRENLKAYSEQWARWLAQ